MLKTVEEIVQALGGSDAAAKATGVGLTAVLMWKARGRIPTARFFLISKLLLKSGHQADPAIFGFVDKVGAK